MAVLKELERQSSHSFNLYMTYLDIKASFTIVIPFLGALGYTQSNKMLGEYRASDGRRPAAEYRGHLL